jgi:hypothetical protein
VTIFEYLSIAFSLGISFAVMRGISGLPHAASSGRIYWVHLTWVCVNLAGAFQFYWGFWAFRDIEWTQPKFISVLAGPALLYAMACILNPDSGSNVASWREYFYRVRVKLFLTGAFFYLVNLSTLIFVAGLPPSDPAFIGQFVALVLAIAGLASDRPAMHAAIASITGAMVLIGAITVFAPVL